MSFDAPLLLEKIKYPSIQAMYVVAKSFTWKINETSYVTIPRGFITDGASIPSELQCILPPLGKYGQAAVLHDYLCEYLSITVDGAPYKVNRVWADAIFCTAMDDLQVSYLVREVMHRAVALYTRLRPSIYLPSNTQAKRNAEAEWSKLNG
jgi:hypothetical protein